MHSECPTSMSCDKLSPRPSPQHSKSLTAPLDCTNCSKQQSNPINNFISKWKYKEDLAKPLNIKRTRPRKQPQTTYHFPLSHCSVNTFNPNNKQNENETTSPPSTPDSMSPTESPRDMSPRDPSPRSPITNLSPRASLSPRSSPRQVSRDTLLKHHRAHLHQAAQEHAPKRQDEREDLLPTYPLHPSAEGQSYDYDMTSPKRHRRTISLPVESSLHISSICNPVMHDTPSSPQSSDDNDDNYSSDPSPYTGNNTVRDSRKRRSGEEGMECETIEISDGESEHLTLSTPQYRNACSFQSRGPAATLDPPPPRTDPISLRPLSLHSAHNDLAKYHLEASNNRIPPPTLPPLNFARLPSIDELWPSSMDECNPRLENREGMRRHPRSSSFSCYYTA